MKIGSMFKDILLSFFSAPITENYPFEKPETAERFRGKLFFDPAKCTGCNLCSKDCPANAIEIVILDRAAKRFVARYIVSEFGCQVEVLGVQPAQNEIGIALSLPVQAAVHEIVERLFAGDRSHSGFNEPVLL